MRVMIDGEGDFEDREEKQVRGKKIRPKIRFHKNGKIVNKALKQYWEDMSF